MRILLVEDHLPLAESVAQALRGAGLTVDMLHDGIAADLALSSEDYALAILDIGLPRLDGFQVLARLRERGTSAIRRSLTLPKKPSSISDSWRMKPLLWLLLSDCAPVIVDRPSTLS